MTEGKYISQLGHAEINKKSKKIILNFDKSISLEIDNKVFLFFGNIVDIPELCKKYSLINHNNQINIIADLYKKKGQKINDLIEGNFPLIIIEKNTKKIEIYSDLGSSFPIYYCDNNNVFLIGTNLKKIIEIEKAWSMPDMVSISRYIMYGEINNLQRTFYKK